MILVSPEWESCYEKRLLPETFIKIQYGVTEPGLNDAAVITGALEEDFSTTAELSDEMAKASQAYATLEKNSWILDGSRNVFSIPPINPGYTSSVVSNTSALYEQFPLITISFPTVHTALIPGVTITWSDSFQEFPTSFLVTIYNGKTAIDSVFIENNNSVVSLITKDIQNYDKISITIYDWCQPNRRARIESIFLGILRIFTKTDLLSYEHTSTVDLLSASLPKNSITFKLNNSDNRWNPNSPVGDYKYLQEMQKLYVDYGMRVGNSIEYIRAGTFWLTEWSTTNTKLEASFTARDSIAWMNSFYMGIRTGTLYEIATAAFEQADLEPLHDGSAAYLVDESLKSTSVNFSDNTETYTIAEILQMVAHAGKCIFCQNAAGVMCIQPLASEINDYTIDGFCSYTEPEISLSKPLKAVSVQYADNTETILVGDTGVVQTVESPLILTKDVAVGVGTLTANILKGRKTVKGSYRADPRMEAGDTVYVQNRFATNKACITSITYSTTGGGFTGKYEGRIL